jgi:hypothetical protein
VRKRKKGGSDKVREEIKNCPKGNTVQLKEERKKLLIRDVEETLSLEEIKETVGRNIDQPERVKKE